MYRGVVQGLLRGIIRSLDHSSHTLRQLVLQWGGVDLEDCVALSSSAARVQGAGLYARYSAFAGMEFAHSGEDEQNLGRFGCGQG